MQTGDVARAGACGKARAFNTHALPRPQLANGRPSEATRRSPVVVGRGERISALALTRLWRRGYRLQWSGTA